MHAEMAKIKPETIKTRDKLWVQLFTPNSDKLLDYYCYVFDSKIEWPPLLPATGLRCVAGGPANVRIMLDGSTVKRHENEPSTSSVPKLSRSDESVKHPNSE